ncbi:MAG: 50S ribosomal protein L23 [Parcubacteria group bacterium]|nr:50S ribosomal protein L23 [Parcubacteria group bacterium]MCR4342665.1 50S ribosomal protein L23 [Patescibacteria group bacterium]
MAILEMFKKGEEKKPKKEAVVKSTIKNTKKPAVKKDEAVKSEKNVKMPVDNSKMFIKLVTEKTTDLAINGAYSFKIDPNSNKIIVKNEIKKLYGVSPVKINIVNSPYKKVSYRGRPSKRPGFKKAIVYLKAGDKLPE